MQAITTKYLGPTDHRGARVRARCQAGSIIVPWDSALDVEANHDAAAFALIHMLGWDAPAYGPWWSGDMPSGSGNVYVCASFPAFRTPSIEGDLADAKEAT